MNSTSHANHMKGSEPTWKVKQLTYEGLPLFIRYPEDLNVDFYKNSFPQLAVITHEFSKVSPSGMPDSDYNDSLSAFDTDLRQMLEAENQGITVLIETFAGKRNYYIYTQRGIDVGSVVSKLSSKYATEKLSHLVRLDKEWNFINRYSKEYLS